METPVVSAAVPARSRILLVEDQTSIREMLSDVLARMDEFEVVGQAADVPEALRLARETQPDVVVLDWRFPNGTGLDFLRELRPSRLQCRVLVLTGNTNDESVGDALAFGARGFFEKLGGLQDFIQAVRTVASGGAYFGPEASAIVDRLVKAKAAQVTRTEASPAPASVSRPRAPEPLSPLSYALG